MPVRERRFRGRKFSMGFRKAFSTSRFGAAGILLLVFAVGTRTLHAEGADELWGREFFAPNAGMADLATGVGPIYAMAVMTNGTIVYAGAVLNSDEGNARVVALSDSKRRRLATPVGIATVYAIALDGTNIYVGGDFKGFKENSAFAMTNIARWDGDKWLALGDGLPAVVHALAVKDGFLFAGYTVTNGTTATGIVSRWDGATWTDLGADLHPEDKSVLAVRALQFVGDRLYVGGNFRSAGGVAATNIAEFSNGQWKGLTMGTNNGVTKGRSLTEVRALAATPAGDLIVGGTFTNAGHTSPDGTVAFYRVVVAN